jgi:predicted kinase
MLFIISGLPSSRKSIVAKLLSERLKSAYLRVDTVEQAIRSAFEHSQKIGSKGYFVL